MINILLPKLLFFLETTKKIERNLQLISKLLQKSVNYKLLTVNYKLVTVYHGSASLMCSKNQNLSYLHVFWSACSIEGYISYIIAI